MLTDPKLVAQVNALWDKFWTGGLANPSTRLRSSWRTPKSEHCDPPLDMFGADAVERWFTDREMTEILNLVEKLEL